MRKIDIGNLKVGVLGDAHLGKTFKTGVPLHRRGHREEMVAAQFRSELETPDLDVIVQVGDLFDKHRVDLNVVVWAHDVIADAAFKSPGTEFVFLAGNHDLSRDLERFSSLQLLARLCRDISNVHFVIDTPLFHLQKATRLLFLPWSPVKTAREVVERYGTNAVDAAFGHWDKVAVGDCSNLIPLDLLAPISPLVISGHDHVPAEFQHGNTQVIYTGSMQPYSFGEDPSGKLYITRTLEELEVTPVEYLNDKCVRVLLKDGETLPEIDCLQIISKKVADEATEELTVEFDEGLNTLRLFEEAMAEVDPEVAALVRNKFQENQHG